MKRIPIRKILLHIAAVLSLAALSFTILNYRVTIMLPPSWR